jgi:hypothetical protein
VLLQPAVEQRHPVRTRHFLLQMSEDLAIQSSVEVLIPPETPGGGLPGSAALRLARWALVLRPRSHAGNGRRVRAVAGLRGRPRSGSDPADP